MVLPSDCPFVSRYDDFLEATGFSLEKRNCNIETEYDHRIGLMYTTYMHAKWGQLENQYGTLLDAKACKDREVEVKETIKETVKLRNHFFEKRFCHKKGNEGCIITLDQLKKVFGES